MNCIEIKNITKTFGDKGVKDLTLNVPTGSIMGFIGENGAGKTTTIKLILNIIKKQNGSIKIFGLDNVTDEKEIKEQIGVVFDECFFHDILKITQIDKIMKTIYRQWDSEVFYSYINKFSLPLKVTVKNYSRGMKMKLSLAVALAHNAKLLILDEATSGLDPIVRSEILDVFLDFIQDEEHTIFISSHITSDLEKIADYITFIHKGELLVCMSKDKLLETHYMVRCKEAQFHKLDQGDIVGFRKNSFGYEVLINNRNKVLRQFPNLIMDPANLDDIMLYYIKGEAV